MIFTKPVAAATYVACRDCGGCPDDVEWDFAAFPRNDKQNFCKSYKGCRALTPHS
jgi:hypothetical protein